MAGVIPEPKRRPIRRWCWRILRWGLAVLLLAWLLRAWWLAPLLKHQLETRLDAALGGSWQIDEVTGSFLVDLRLGGIRQIESGSGPVRAASCREIRVTWSLSALFEGPALGALSSLRIADADLVLSRTAPREPRSGGSAGQELLWRQLGALDPDLVLAVQDSRIAWQADGTVLQAVDLDLDGNLGEWRIATVPWHDDRELPELAVAGTLRPVDNGLELEADLDWDGLDLHGTLLTGQHQPLDLDLRGSWWSGRVEAGLVADRWRLGLEALPLAPLASLLAADRELPAITGSVSVVASGSGTAVTAGIATTGLQVAERPGRLSAELTWQDGELSAEDLELGLGGLALHTARLVWSPARGLRELAPARLQLDHQVLEPYWPASLGDDGQAELVARCNDGRCRIDGSVTAPGLQGELQVELPGSALGLPPSDVPVSGRLVLEAEGLDVPELLLQLDSGQLRADLQGTVLDPELVWRTGGEGLQRGAASFASFAANGTLTAQRFTVEEGELIAEGQHLQLSRPLLLGIDAERHWSLDLAIDRIGGGMFDLVAHGQALRVDAVRGSGRIRVATFLPLLVPELGDARGTLELAVALHRDPGAGLAGDATILLRDLTLAGAAGPTTCRVELQADGERVAVAADLSGRHSGGLAGTVTMNGDLADWRFWSCELDLTDLTVQLEDLPLEPFWPYWLSGRVTVDGRVAGPLAAPWWSAQVAVSELSATLPGALPPLTGGHARITLRPHQVVIDRLHVESGAGPLDVVGVWSFDDDGPCALHVGGRQVLHRQRPDLRLRADLELLLAGSTAQPRLSGRASITDLLLSTQVDWLGNLMARGGGIPWIMPVVPEPWNRLALDVAVTDGSIDGRASAGLRLRSNVFSGDLGLDLDLGGSLARPQLDGIVTCQEARVSLPFTRFRLERAVLTFSGGERLLDPEVEARLHARLQGYEITVEVEGRVSDPRVTVSTIPPLPEAQALLLASTGLLPADLVDNALGNVVSTALPLLGRELQLRLFGPSDPDAEEGFFDRLDLSTDEARSEAGLSTIRLEYRLGHGWSLYGERDVWEQYNGGLVWRRRFGGTWAPAERSEAVEPPPDTGPPWTVEAAGPDERLPLRAGALLGEVRRQRRSWFEDDEHDAHLVDAAFSMGERLRSLGYDRAEVVWQRSQDGGVVFRVASGPRYRFAGVSITGLPIDLEEELVASLTGHLEELEWWDPGLVGQAKNFILARLRGAGHVLAQVDEVGRVHNEVAGTIRFQLAVDAGPRFRFAAPDLVWQGEHRPEEALRGRIAAEVAAMTGEPWQRGRLGILRGVLSALLAREGRQLADIRLETEDPTHDGPAALALKVVIDPGPILLLGELDIVGLQRTRDSYLRRRLGLSPGDVLDRSRDSGIVRSLRGTRLFSRIDSAFTIRERQGDRAIADVLITVEEAPSRSVEVAMGYGSWEGVRGGVGWRDSNLFGIGRTWLLDVDGSQRHARAGTTLVDRDLLGGDRELSLIGSASRREAPSFTSTTYEVDLLARFPMGGRDRLDVGYALKSEQARDLEAEIAGAETSDFLLTSKLFARYLDDDYDDPWLPTEGTMIEFGLGVADPVLGSDLGYLEPSIRAGAVLSLGRHHVIALGGGFLSRIPTDGNETLPIQERLFLGGADSVRSFGVDELSPVDAGDNALGGLTSAHATIEWRMRLHQAVHGAVFYDIGIVDEDAFDFDSDTVGQAIGVGLRWYLPVGPLRFDIAANPGKRFAAERDWAMHIAVGFSF